MQFQESNPIETTGARRWTGQYGGGLLPVIAVASVVMVMVQGTIFHKAKTSSAFLAGEKHKVLAQQAAEAGVEDAIADLGMRRVTVTSGMHDYPIADHKSMGEGVFSTTLTTVAQGSGVDTVDLASQGSARGKSQSVLARLRLHNIFDTSFSVVAFSAPYDTTIDSISLHVTNTQTITDPNTVPALNTTSAYAACMSSGAKKCDVCHLPGGDVTKANVINISKSAINTHVSHHGDYVTTDGTCDVFLPKIVSDTTVVVTPVHRTLTRSILDSIPTITPSVKVQVLSWR